MKLAPRTAIIREAAELLAYYDAMRAARRVVSMRMAPLAHDFILRLMRAQGRRERYETSPPAPFLGRPLTLYARINRGHGEALLAPNMLSRQTAVEWLDQGNAGFFHRPEDWSDTRYYDAFSVFCSPATWMQVADPLTGIVALAAAASISLSDLDDQELGAHMDRKGSPPGFAWSQDFLLKIRGAATKVEIPDREPPFIPTKILPHAAERDLGWGEALAFWLYADKSGPNLSAKQVGRMLGITNDEQVRRMARVAGRKLGVDTLVRLVPPWPKESGPITIKEPKYDIPDTQGGER